MVLNNRNKYIMNGLVVYKNCKVNILWNRYVWNEVGLYKI